MENMFALKNDCLYVWMPKEMDHHTVDALRLEIDDYLLSQKAQNVVLDFEETRFMDSSGIGLIVGRYKKVSCMGGKILALHVNARIQKILMMAGLRDMIEIV